MHATEPDNDQNKTANQDRTACSYSLESLMALQKLLENGFPEGESAPCPPQLSPMANCARTSPRWHASEPVARVTREWRKSLRLLLMKFTRSREAGKGNAHHTF